MSLLVLAETPCQRAIAPPKAGIARRFTGTQPPEKSLICLVHALQYVLLKVLWHILIIGIAMPRRRQFLRLLIKSERGTFGFVDAFASIQCRILEL